MLKMEACKNCFGKTGCTYAGSLKFCAHCAEECEFGRGMCSCHCCERPPFGVSYKGSSVLGFIMWSGFV
jgi:hypothetical protein